MGNQKMQGPVISVIIPVYSVAPYVRESLDSVINQTYHSLEILVIEDGSTDESGAICDEYASFDPRITVIHQPHHNVSVARNTALDLATGDYIAFLDPDDAWHPSFAQTMLDTILRENSDIVVCNYKTYHTTEKLGQWEQGVLYPLISPGLYNRTQALHGLLDRRMGPVIWNKIYKRELWNDVRFPADLYAGTDYVGLFQVFFNCHSVYVIDRPLYMYRKHPGSLTAVYSTRILSSRILGRLYISDFLRAHSPQIFSKQQIRNYDKTALTTTMLNYTRCYEKEGSEYLKQLITDMADKIGIANCGLKTRIMYFMMRHSPGLLKCVYPAYLQIRLFVKKITGK